MANYKPVRHWQGKVYKKNHYHYPDNWPETRKRIFERDHHECYRCLHRNGTGKGLTAHHLIPRSEGGGDNDENLITLCFTCHDYVEINELRSLADIAGSLDLGIKVRELKTVKHDKEDFERPDWHAWVYGGIKRNQL